MKLRALLFILVGFLTQLTISSHAQTGLPPFGSFQDGQFDAVNLQNLNVNFMIPVVQHPGRGLPFQDGLFYNSLVYTPTSTAWTQSSRLDNGWNASGPGGTLQYSEGFSDACPSGVQAWTNWVYTDPAGTPHSFPLIHWGTNACGLLEGNTAYASDASGYYIDVVSTTNPVVLAPDGTRLVFTGGSINGTYLLQKPNITDPNGNQVTNTTQLQTGEVDWKDTLGQIVLKITQVSNGTGLIIETDYSRLAVDGSYQTVAVKYQFVSVQTNFACPGLAEYSGTNLRVVSEIDLPNSQKYLFGYEPTPGSTSTVTGRIQQVTLPTGGTITYQYNGPNDGINCADGTVLSLTRIVNDGTISTTWTYTRSGVSGSAGTTTMTAPQLSYDAAANQTVVTFDAKGRESTQKIYQGSSSGTPIRTVNTNWATNNTPSTRTVILEDGLTQSEVETSYDSNGNLLSSKEHDWGQGAPGMVLRTTTLSYLSTSAYTALNILNRLQDKTIADASGAVKSRFHIDYDQLGGTGQGQINATCVTGAPQQDPNYGCSYTTRGLPTAVTTYTDAATPSGAITKTFKYDSVGNLVSAQLNCCQQKQWTFSSATQYAFPDSVTSGAGSPQLTTSATYYLTTGQLKTSMDENGQVTTYSYADPGHLDRLTDVQRPDLAHLTTVYDDLGLKVTSTSPLQGTDVVKGITAFDGMGRPITQTTEDAANNVYSVTDTQYDVLGRPYKTSNPHTGAAQFWTTNQFDALGRPTLTLLPDNSQGSSAYALNSATATDPAGKQRKSSIDGLGRLIEVDEPGDSSSGAQAQGSITINDPLNSKPTIPATSGSGSITISGVEQQTITCTRTCTSHWDTGFVSISVVLPTGTVTKQQGYGQGSSAQSIADSLASQFSADGSFKNVNVVENSTTSYTINLTASAVGSASNYPYSASGSSTKDFSATPAGPTFVGGVDGQTGATDSGTISLSVGSFTTAPVCYGTSCNSTAALVASALASALNVSGSPVQNNVHVSGNIISMTANAFSASWNVAVTATPTSNDPADFPNGSFASQGALGGGADPYSSGLAHPYTTTYQYGVFDNLLQVTQGVQTRIYGYDGMGRMTDVTTPEAGHVNLQYNSFDLVTKRTDARNVVTNYGYDTLNRLQEIDYDVSGAPSVPATPSVVYTYGTSSALNNNGRITTITDGLGSENYSYDQLGRIGQLQKVINGTTYTIGYSYNLAGEVTSLTYPSGHVVQQSFDPIGRLCEIAPQTSGCGTATAPYANQFGYNSAFQTTGFTYGNGVSAAFNFSPDRLQLTNLSYTKATQTLFGLNYYYKQDATNCPTAPTANNGQIQCITDLVDSGRNVSYTYDTLGRLSAAITKGSTAYPQWGLAFTMDRYGNVTQQTTTAGSAPQFPAPVNAVNNQINTLPYDSSGNLLNDGTNELVYDAESRILTSTSGGATSAYSYDGKSLRVKKVSGGVTTVYIFAGEKVIAEYENGAVPASPTREYIYAGSNMLAKIEAGATTYYIRDHLSNRVVADATGAVTGQMGNFPYGQSWYDSNVTKWKFTTYERDSESQNDYALARYYINLKDRFSSPDPVIGSSQNPQSWNRYAYARNDPINSTDPTGQFVTGLDRGFQSLYLSATAVAIGLGGGCVADLMPIPCLTGGNDIFDALAGKPGTFVTVGGGHIGFGFDPDLWWAGQSFLDTLRAQINQQNQRRGRVFNAALVPAPSLLTIVHNVGNTSQVEGLLPDLQDIKDESARLMAQWPQFVTQLLASDPTASPKDILRDVRTLGVFFPDFQDLLTSQQTYWQALYSKWDNVVFDMSQLVTLTPR